MNPAAAIEAWRRARLERLTAPDGWLSLVGLPWLRAGVNRIGSAPDNDIVLADVPAHLARLDWREDGSVQCQLLDAAGSFDGWEERCVDLCDDEHTPTTIVRAGDVHFFLVRRGSQVGLRVKHVHAPTRTGFQGLEYFPVDPGWRMLARWEPAVAGEVLPMATVIGTLEEHPVAGHAVLERAGQRHVVLPVIEAGAGEAFFLVFADLTSGRETYGAARFLYTEPASAGRIVLDFNRAYNPPCAFTAFATCPMAPPENRLPWRVTAGEKSYRGGPHHA